MSDTTDLELKLYIAMCELLAVLLHHKNLKRFEGYAKSLFSFVAACSKKLCKWWKKLRKRRKKRGQSRRHRNRRARRRRTSNRD